MFDRDISIAEMKRYVILMAADLRQLGRTGDIEGCRVFRRHLADLVQLTRKMEDEGNKSIHIARKNALSGRPDTVSG